MTRPPAPMIHVVSSKEGPSRKTGRWFRLEDYEDEDHLYGAIARWLGKLNRNASVDASGIRFAEYRNMPSFGPVPQRIWIADYIAALRAGADPDALMAYVDCGGHPPDFAQSYVGWFESLEEFAAHHLRHRVLSMAGLDELRAFVDLDAVAQSLAGTHFEIRGHYFRRGR